MFFWSENIYVRKIKNGLYGPKGLKNSFILIYLFIFKKVLKDHLSGLFSSPHFINYFINYVILSALCNFYFICFNILKQKQMFYIWIKQICLFYKILPTVSIVFLPSNSTHTHTDRPKVLGSVSWDCTVCPQPEWVVCNERGA